MKDDFSQQTFYFPRVLSILRLQHIALQKQTYYSSRVFQRNIVPDPPVYLRYQEAGDGGGGGVVVKAVRDDSVQWECVQ